jgi:hypothetical protein
MIEPPVVAYATASLPRQPRIKSVSNPMPGHDVLRAAGALHAADAVFDRLEDIDF